MPAAEDAAGDRPGPEGAVSTGEAPAPGERAAADTPNAAGDQYGPDSNGHGFTPDDRPGGREQAPGPDNGPGSPDEGRAPDGPADQNADAGDPVDPQIPSGLAHRPAGFATGHVGPDPAPHSARE